MSETATQPAHQYESERKADEKSAAERAAKKDKRLTTPAEMEKYEKLFASDAMFSKNSAPDEKFFYKIISMHPRTVGPMESEAIQQFNIQKYHKDKFADSTEYDDRGTIKSQGKKPMAVTQFDEHGKLTDKYASFFIDCVDFCEQFKKITSD